MDGAGVARREDAHAAPSASPCPGCGTAVDALRAGHVAIFDGLFLYYCDARCKVQHLLAIAGDADQVVTMDPPAVMERNAERARARDGETPASHARAKGNANGNANGSHAPSASREEPFFPVVETKPSPLLDAPFAAHASSTAFPASPTSEEPFAADAERERDEREARAEPADEEQNGLPSSYDQIDLTEDPQSDPLEPLSRPLGKVTALATLKSLLPTVPSTLRSPALAEAAPLAPEVVTAPRLALPATRERVRSIAAGTACVTGLLAAGAGVVDATVLPRVALACIAAGGLSLRVALADEDDAAAHPAVTIGPIVAAIALSFVALATSDTSAASIATLAGLASAVAAASEELLLRAGRATDVARRAITRALDVDARVARSGGETATRDVRAGETVLVEAGETVAVDGAVIAGEAAVIPWHDAPLEVTKSEGDTVVAGARVVSGRLRVMTASSGADRAWLRACAAPAVRADVSAPIPRVARLVLERATPLVALVAAAVCFASGGAPHLVDALAVACAVAIAFSARSVVASVALVNARAQVRALTHGVVYKDARAFDAAGRADVAVVCARGTVLTGEPEIVAIEGAGSAHSEPKILALAAGAESASSHPFAAAILRAARTRGVTPESVRSTTAHEGLGVTALTADGDRLVVGSRAFLLREKVSVAVAETRASELEAQGRSVLLVALGGKLVGLVALQDGLRAGARAAIQRLVDARIEPVLLSGESRETCETIARALDLDHVRPEVLPADRGAEVRALAEGGHIVAVVGHPSSDDSALGAADVSIAMAASRATHTHVPDHAVTLASDDVRDAAIALSLPRAARDLSRVALVAGVAPGVVAFLGFALGVLPIGCAPFAMALGASAALVVARRT